MRYIARRELAERLGVEAADRIVSSLGGHRVYVAAQPEPFSAIVHRLGTKLAHNLADAVVKDERYAVIIIPKES